MSLITKPGIYPNITSAEYFAEPCPDPALTCSTMKTLLYRTAAEAAYEHPALTPNPERVRKSTADKRFGDVAHQLALGKGRGYAVGDFPTWGSNAAKEFKADAEKRLLTPVKKAEFDAARDTAVIMRNRFRRYLEKAGNGHPHEYGTEVVFAWIEETQFGPIWCRAMADVWCEELGIIVDPKFSKVMADGAFEAHAVKMGWDLQDVWYRRGMEKLLPDQAGRIKFVNALVHPDPPHVSRIREADEATRSSLRETVDDQINHFAACLYGNFWPGYPEGPETWSARNWTMTERKMQALEMMEDEEA